jgi:squalene-hopene/tetraprenyl-beta-curcumene cyclase
MTSSNFAACFRISMLIALVPACASHVSDQETAVSQNDNSAETAKQSPQATVNPPGKSFAEIDRNLFRKITGKGVAFLLEKGQAEDGSFSKQLSPAVTAMCTSALLEHGVPLEHRQIRRALSYLESFIQPDGGIYPPGSNLRNYETSVSLMCFQRANVGGKYDKVIQDAVGFLKGLQWDDGEGHAFESTFYGGQGYGNHKRPDASNTSYFLDALEAAGEDGDSVAIQKALVFMSRCQNMSSQHNTAEWAANVSAEDRGGGIYTGVGEGESKSGKTPEGGLRSYASMTYAGLKSFLYAGIAKDDIRVKAALDWIGRHYDLESNPGMGQQGLYYYYHVFAKTLNAVGEPLLIDSQGQAHNWRNDLIKQLASQQKADGSWINPADRWYEGDPNLVTSYALLALGYCNPDKTGSSQPK